METLSVTQSFKRFVHPDDTAGFVQQGVRQSQLLEQLFLDLSVLRGKIDQFRAQRRPGEDHHTDDDHQIHHHKYREDDAGFDIDKVDPHIYQGQNHPKQKRHLQIRFQLTTDIQFLSAILFFAFFVFCSHIA